MRPASMTKFVIILSPSLAEGSSESTDTVFSLVCSVLSCLEKLMRSLTANVLTK